MGGRLSPWLFRKYTAWRGSADSERGTHRTNIIITVRNRDTGLHGNRFGEFQLSNHSAENTTDTTETVEYATLFESTSPSSSSRIILYRNQNRLARTFKTSRHIRLRVGVLGVSC